jgi:hypothetical protein
MRRIVGCQQHPLGYVLGEIADVLNIIGNAQRR